MTEKETPTGGRMTAPLSPKYEYRKAQSANLFARPCGGAVKCRPDRRRVGSLFEEGAHRRLESSFRNFVNISVREHSNCAAPGFG